MKWKKETENWHKANYAQAIALLKDDKLIWSGDMESIRNLLADVFSEHASDDDFSYTTLNYLAERLLEDENDLTWGR